jgi:hypothetical protein
MKRRLSYMMMVGLSAVLLASCNREVIQENSYGYLGIKLDNDLSEDVIVKADAAEDLVFAVDVRNATGTVASVEDHRTVTTDNPIKLQIGTYDVVASSGPMVNAAFNSPIYKGSKQAQIYPDKINTVNLTCTLANTVFSVDFPSDFSNHFDVYEVEVTNGKGDKLVLSNTPQPGNSLEAGFDAKAYFDVTGSLTWNLYLQNKDHQPGSEGGIYRHTVTYQDVKARQHYHLTFELGNNETADGAFILKVILDSTMDDSSHELTLDFNNKDIPAFSTNSEFAAVSGGTVAVPVGNTVTKVFSASTPAGLKNFRIEHNDEGLLAAGLPQNVDLVSDPEAVAGIGFVLSQMTAGSKTPAIDLTTFVSKLPVGVYSMALSVVDAKGHYDHFDFGLEIISDVDAEAVAAYTGWASFAKLEARYFTQTPPAGLSFQYKKVSDTQWKEVPVSDVTINTATLRYETLLFGLSPATDYVFRAVSAEDKETKEISFKTAGAEILHNLSFDEWYQNGKAWIPNASSSTYVWDSANPGTASLGLVPTTPEESDVVKGKAARLETGAAMGMLAAGNIYVGQFGKVAGLGAELDWGYPFTSRPLALKGYYKYSPKAIDQVKDPYKDLKGETDHCQIQILLTDWADRFHINTSKKVFVDFENDQNIIAHGAIASDNTDTGYVKFTIPLVYRNNRIPKYIVIVGAASKLGDYFTGAVGSVLLLDEFELVYDPAELTEDEFNTVFSKVNPF